MNALAEKLGGRFVVIDGPDGSGKSTQLALLADHLRAAGLAVTATRDPGGTPIGDRIRAILLDNAHGEMTVACELMLYMASRAQLYGEVIAPALSRGECVLCDRWVSSTVAYQGAGGVAAGTVMQAYEAALPGVSPHVTVILDLPADAGLARAKGRAAHDRMESKGAGFHRRVRELFLQQAHERPERFVVVDAAGAVGPVQQRLREALASHPLQND